VAANLLAEGMSQSIDEPQTKPVALSDIMYLALCRVAADPGNWPLLHGHTRRVLLERRLVDVSWDEQPLLTELARDAVAHYEERHQYPNVEQASSEELDWAAAIIGLDLKRHSRRKLLFFEHMISRRSLQTLKADAQYAGVQMPTLLGEDEAMLKRRALAIIANVGMLAQVL
jgi:hypothetical protein